MSQPSLDFKAFGIKFNANGWQALVAVVIIVGLIALWQG
jgi:hypothetical protein